MMPVAGIMIKAVNFLTALSLLVLVCGGNPVLLCSQRLALKKVFISSAHSSARMPPVTTVFL